jgi:Icc protein
MVRQSIALVLATFTLSCAYESPSGFRARDLLTGQIENESFRFVAQDGMLHITAASASTITARASASTFSARLTRKVGSVASVRLSITNLPDSPQLTVAGVPTAGTADSSLSHGYYWDIVFGGANDVDVELPASTTQPFRFLAFGDIQNGIDRFGEMVTAVNQESTAEFILMLGDLSNRARPSEFDRVDEYFKQIRVPIYTTPGNHDAFAQDTYQDRYGRASYSFVHRGVRFTSLDSSSAELDSEVWGWARTWMQLGASITHVIFSHIPVTEASGIRSGQWNSRREAAKFLAMARQNAVDLMLFGHVHSFDAYTLAGIPARISGGCGAIEERLDGIDRHYLRVDVTPATGALQIEAVRIE